MLSTVKLPFFLFQFFAGWEEVMMHRMHTVRSGCYDLKVGYLQKPFGVFCCKDNFFFSAKHKSQGIVHSKCVFYPWAKPPAPYSKCIYAQSLISTFIPNVPNSDVVSHDHPGLLLLLTCALTSLLRYLALSVHPFTLWLSSSVTIWMYQNDCFIPLWVSICVSILMMFFIYFFENFVQYILIIFFLLS